MVSRALALGTVWASATAAAFLWTTVAIAVVSSLVLTFVEVSLLILLGDLEVVVVNTELVDVGAGRSVDTRKASMLEVESVSLADNSTIWSKELALLGTEGDRGDLGLNVIGSSHNELVDAIRDGVNGDLGDPFGTSGVTVDSTEHGGLADHVLPVDSHGVEVWSVVKFDEIDEPVGGCWLIIEWSTSEVTIWTLGNNLVEVDLIIGNGERLNFGHWLVIILHVGNGTDSGNQSSESDSNTFLHLS